MLTEALSNNNIDHIRFNGKERINEECDNINSKKKPPKNLTKFVNKQLSPLNPPPLKVQEMLERMDKYSKEKAKRLEEKKKQFANDLLSKIPLIPQINEKSRKLVNKDFFTRQEDYKTARITIQRNLLNLNEEKIKRELTPDLSRKRNPNEDKLSYKSIVDNINFQIQWDTERKQRIEVFREKESFDLSKECTFTPKIGKKSLFIAKKK